MAKDKSKKPAAASAASDAALKLTAAKKAIDPTLASLFATSVGPAKPRPKEAYRQAPPKPAPEVEADDEEDAEGADEDDEDLSSIDEDLPDDDDDDDDGDAVMRSADDASSDEETEIPVHEALAAAQAEKSQRKRKRKGGEDELEDAYMRKLEKEEARDEAKREAERSTKRQKKEDGEAADGSDESDEDEKASSDADEDQEDSDAESDFEKPQHETQTSQPKGDSELEKASRTVFLGNVSTRAISDKSAKKALVKHMSSFLPELPEHKPPHRFESIRFRSTPFSTYIPKKAAFVTKEVMDETAHSTNAYVVYSTNQAAREAARRLNGTVVLERHLRVDEVAHPAKTDHHRCVFVGNLAFVDDESAIQEAEAKKLGKEIRKKKEPGDVEEGLWRTFGKAGTVESVRVIRDPKTRVGKGFAYVQFTDENAVEAALLYNDKKFPPMLPRKLRVVRAKGIKRNKVNSASSTRPVSTKGVYNPKISAEERSMQGRAAKLLGKAGASKIRSHGKPGGNKDSKREEKPANGFKTPEQFVFEGHRASEKQGKTGLKLGGKKGKKGGKPTSRSSKRGSAWKAAGGNKA